MVGLADVVVALYGRVFKGGVSGVVVVGVGWRVLESLVVVFVVCRAARPRC